MKHFSNNVITLTVYTKSSSREIKVLKGAMERAFEEMDIKEHTMVTGHGRAFKPFTLWRVEGKLLFTDGHPQSIENGEPDWDYPLEIVTQPASYSWWRKDTVYVTG